MSAVDIARKFMDWVEATEFDQEPGWCDLFNYFQLWAMNDGDLIAETGDDYTMALQVWIIVTAWFNQRPDHFEPLRKSVTSVHRPGVLLILEVPVPEERSTDIHDDDVLRSFLDPAEWRRLAFERKYPRRR